MAWVWHEMVDGVPRGRGCAERGVGAGDGGEGIWRERARGGRGAMVSRCRVGVGLSVGCMVCVAWWHGDVAWWPGGVAWWCGGVGHALSTRFDLVCSTRFDLVCAGLSNYERPAPAHPRERRMEAQQR